MNRLHWSHRNDAKQTTRHLGLAGIVAAWRVRVDTIDRASLFGAAAATRPALRVGFVPLTDCAPLAMAQELGLFARYGLNVVLQREIGWAAIRDKIIDGSLHAAHAVAGMPVATALGIGCTPCECVTGFVFNLNGNAITLSTALAREGVRDGATLHEFIRRQHGRRTLTFGVVFPFASHNFLLRRWLTTAGIDPDKDVRIVIVPPPQMPNALKAGHIDGCCAGEPWNSVALQARLGWCVGVSAEIDPGHPEKVLMVRRDFAQHRAAEHEALIAALLDAAEYCDAPANREHVIQVLARREYLDRAPVTLRPGLSGEFDFGHGEVRTVRDFVVFHRDHANEPSADKAAWVINQLRASNVVPDPARLRPALGPSLFRPDIFERAARLRSSQPTTASNEKLKLNLTSPSAELSRRHFLRRSARGLTATALLAGLPRDWVGSAYASDAPETAKLRCGIIALTDCSPLVIAAEKGMFKKYGLDVTIAKGANWAAIRDSLSSGDNQMTHMLIGMPIASTMGLLGSPKKPMVIPWLLNRNGQAITLKAEFKGKVGADPKAFKPFVEKAKKLGEPLSFAMTFPPGTHAMWMRYYLAAGGINPDKDISLITIPPPQMVANMKVGKMDGFCVGEPWNARAIADKIGFTSRHHPGHLEGSPGKGLRLYRRVRRVKIPRR